MKGKKILSLLLAVVLVFALCGGALAADAEPVVTAESEGVVVFYTNDVHTYISEDITYSKVAALKAGYDNALLVDAGDHAQGTAYGSMDKGATITALMNAAGYDAATLGNHEFDYGMAGALSIIEKAEFPYLSCNFYHESNGVAGASVLDAYKVFEVNGVKVAFVGITTPESFTKSTPAYFQDANGKYIYGIAGGTDGKALYAAVQKAIDAAAKEADYVIALGHLGEDPASDPWNSEDVIANTSGLDAFIDGHSHSSVPGKEVKDKAGDTVILTQTGSYLEAVGKLTIDAEGMISTELLTAESAEIAALTPDADVMAIEDAWIAEVDTMLGEVIGSFADVMNNYDAAGNRLVRKQETNEGDFCADALYYLFDNLDYDVDVAIMNGGGIRNKSVTGEISYKTCKEIHTFGNVACLQTITGQQLLDALEWGAKDVDGAGTKENGGFLQVSGIMYTIDTTVPSTVQKDEKNVWSGAPTGSYRVKDVMILNNTTGEYEALDLAANYNLAGYNYTLRDLGDGFAMFDGAVNVIDYVMEDYMVLANYVKSFEDGVVTGYAEPAGRIFIYRLVTEAFSDVPAGDWYVDFVQYCYDNKLMEGMGDGTFAPFTEMNRAMLAAMLYRLEGSPAVEGKVSEVFTDCADDAWYASAVLWAYQNKIVEGDGMMFKPTAMLSRQDMVTMLYRYQVFKEVDVSVGEDTNILSYLDVEDVAEYAIPAMQWACGAGVVEGDNGYLTPLDAALRAHAAAVFTRLAA